jgi:hypothetical protein
LLSYFLVLYKGKYSLNNFGLSVIGQVRGLALI